MAGCSFSAGSSDIQQAINNPETWAHFLIPEIQPKFFYNLAIPGGGNRQIADNLIYLLETKKHIVPESTLVLLNFTGLDRIDTMCSVEHPDANEYFSWSKDLGYGWIVEGGFCANTTPFRGSLQKNMELSQIQRINCLAIVQCLSYLQHRGFRFFFMLMNDDIINDSEKWFQSKLLDDYTNNFVKIESHLSMYAFAKSNNLLHEDQFHPNVKAQELIAQQLKSVLTFD